MEKDGNTNLNTGASVHAKTKQRSWKRQQAQRVDYLQRQNRVLTPNGGSSGGVDGKEGLVTRGRGGSKEASENARNRKFGFDKIILNLCTPYERFDSIFNLSLFSLFYSSILQFNYFL